MANARKPNVSFPHFWGIAPAEDLGPMVLPFTLEFVSRGALALSYDVELEQFQNQIGCIQAVFVDNNTSSVITLNSRPSGFLQRFRAMTNGWVPFLSGDQLQFDATIAAAPAADVKVYFANVPIITGLWQLN